MTSFSAAGAAEELLDLVQRFEIDSVVERFAPTGVLDLPNRPGGAPTTLVGHAEIGTFMRLLPKLFPRLVFGERQFHQMADPRCVVVEYRGDGVARTGRPYNNRYISVLEFDEHGSVVLWREYFDSQIVIDALA